MRVNPNVIGVMPAPMVNLANSAHKASQDIVRIVSHTCRCILDRAQQKTLTAR